MSGPSIQALLDDIIRSHGGSERFGPVDHAIGFQLATLLASPSSDPAKHAQALSSLAALLPPRVEAPVRELDLTRLTDRQLHQLHKLVAIAEGAEPPKPLPRAPERSARYWDCLGLADWLDALPKGHVLDRQEVSVLAGKICAVVSEFILPRRMYELVYGGMCRHAPEMAAQADDEVRAPEIVAEANVVRLLPPSQGILGGCGR